MVSGALGGSGEPADFNPHMKRVKNTVKISFDAIKHHFVDDSGAPVKLGRPAPGARKRDASAVLAALEGQEVGEQARAAIEQAKGRTDG